MKRSFIACLCIISLLCSICAAAPGVLVFAESVEQANRVEVSNVDEFLAALASDTTIVLAPGEYRLSSASSYGKSTGGNYSWRNLGGVYELDIEGLDNLSIIGKDAEIVTEPRWADVLRFEHCYKLSLEGLTVGHTQQTEACEGGVIYLSRCDKAKIEGCSLYGCGTIGIQAYDCYGLTINSVDIYHCSSCGLDINNSSRVNVSDLRIFDCGNDESIGKAWTAINVYDTEDMTVSACEIFDNRFINIIYGNSETIVFKDLSIHDNSSETAFCYSGKLRTEGLKMENNSFNSWFSTAYSTTLVTNVQIPDVDKLNERYPGQIAGIELGSVDTERIYPDICQLQEVHVSTADEFLAAIASNTHIIIDSGRIDLTEASDYGKDAVELYYSPSNAVFDNSSYIWEEVYDGYALVIGRVDNLYISGGEIVTRPRYANVLNFYYCGGIGLQELTLGHSPEEGVCAGGVVYLYCCSDTFIDKCDLYGCGIYGLTANYSPAIRMQDTLVHDCSYGGVELFHCPDSVFIDCTAKNVPSYAFKFSECENLVWNNSLLNSSCYFDTEPFRG